MNTHPAPSTNIVSTAATAVLRTEERTVMVPKTETISFVSIELKMTPEQASGVLRLCEHIGGAPEGTRGVFSALSGALWKAGVRPAAPSVLTINKSSHPSSPGSVYFNP